MSKRGSNALMVFLTGAAIGALIGILYAPDKGTNTREKLSFKLDKYKKVLQGYLDDLKAGRDTPLTAAAKSKGTQVISEARTKAERLLEDVDSLLEQIRGKKS
ncbi:MAG: YtxH domain-containing protein [Flammeovirgaceae bacterium]|nr:YtxH domain-containing protein [Flammeovirgaceae bacterium]